MVSYLSPTGFEATPAYTSRENETSENKEEDDHHDAKTDNKHLQSVELSPVPKVERQVVHVTTESLLQLTSRKHSGGDRVQVSQQGLRYYFIF